MSKVDVLDKSVDTEAAVQYKYKIREKFYVLKYEKRCAIARAMRKKYKISDTTWRRWMAIEAGDSQELTLAQLQYIADQFGCTWIDLLNDEMKDSLSLGD